jgi:hypothetical protein
MNTIDREALGRLPTVHSIRLFAVATPVLREHSHQTGARSYLAFYIGVHGGTVSVNVFFPINSYRTKIVIYNDHLDFADIRLNFVSARI